MKCQKKILYVVNSLDFFLSHRLPLAIAAKAEGYSVCVASAFGHEVSEIERYGFVHYTVPFARSGQNPLKEVITIYHLIRLFKMLKPDLIHLVTIKPVLYGGIAARITGIQVVVSAVSGLGTVFLAGTFPEKVRRWIVQQLYKSAFNLRGLAVIFQNSDDRDTLLDTGAVALSETRMIRGSGVDLAEYPYLPEPEGKPIVIMAARLIRDKGVFEFVQAAEFLDKRGVNVVMRLVGAPDPGNPTSVSECDLKDWNRGRLVDVVGYRQNIAEQYAAANVVCLPSYREGLPKGLVEAAACGRAVITTDVPGCRDAITPGITGKLVPLRDASALADAIQSLIESPSLRKQMGQAGRALAEKEFAIEKIVDQHMKIYQDLLGRCRKS